MTKPLAAAVVAASLAVGGLTGAALGAPGVASATDVAASAPMTAADRAGWVEDALAGLVTEGTITQEQADAVATALDDARPDRGPRGMRHLHLDAIADALGVTADELRTALQGGQTIAEVAAAEGVDLQTVVDAVVAELEARLTERVEAGDITQERADEMIARASERLPDALESDGPAFGGRGRHGR